MSHAIRSPNIKPPAPDRAMPTQARARSPRLGRIVARIARRLRSTGGSRDGRHGAGELKHLGKRLGEPRRVAAPNGDRAND
jgi:hypothetical protein